MKVGLKTFKRRLGEYLTSVPDDLCNGIRYQKRRSLNINFLIKLLIKLISENEGRQQRRAIILFLGGHQVPAQTLQKVSSKGKVYIVKLRNFN